MWKTRISYKLSYDRDRVPAHLGSKSYIIGGLSDYLSWTTMNLRQVYQMLIQLSSCLKEILVSDWVDISIDFPESKNTSHTYYLGMHQVVDRVSSDGNVCIQDLSSPFVENPYNIREDVSTARPADQCHLQGWTSDTNV